jgi:MFS family permease
MTSGTTLRSTPKTPLSAITRQQWLTLFAAQAGYMLDAMDVLLFVFAVNSIRDQFGFSAAQAGLVSSFTLAFSAIGGIGFGILSDRFGRARTLIWSIVIYSIASAGTAMSWNLASLLFWRAAIGIGLGAEWSSGAVLVAETWPAEHRAKAVGIMQSGWALGYMLAAGITALILPRWGWRALFLTGLFPALFAVLLQRKLKEPEIWTHRKAAAPGSNSIRIIFQGQLLRRTLLGSALATSVLFAYWGLFTWIPGFLSASPARGGAGLSIVSASSFIIPMQLGAFAGYVAFGWLADKIGRRPAFVLYVIGAALLTPVYGASRDARTLLLLGPTIGFLGTGFFSLFGTLLAELYPTAVRGTGQGFVYNIGRGLSSMAPWLVGFFADRYGIGASLALNSAFFLLGAALIFTLPETKQTDLI